MKKLAYGLCFFIIVIMLCIACSMTPQAVHDIQFTEDVCIQPYSRYTYKTGKVIVVRVDEKLFIIPEGFETDLASIPRWYWSILSPQYSAFVTPSIIHDYFYRCANYENRRFADDVFYYALLKNGVSVFTAKKFYLAVRVFGAHSYTKDLRCEDAREI